MVADEKDFSAIDGHAAEDELPPLPTLAHDVDPSNSVALAFAQGARDHAAGIVHPVPKSYNPLQRTRAADGMGARTSTIQSVRSAQTRNGALIPAEFRTLSIQVGEAREHERRQANDKLSVKGELADKLGLNALRRAKDNRKKDKGAPAMDVDYFAQMSYHTTPATQVAQELEVNLDTGLDDAEAQSRLSRDGPNAIKPKKPNYPLKLFKYFFGGFGAILSIAVVLFGISYKPLGNPDPAPYNLALAILVLIVIFLQGLFNAAQDWSTSRVMNSIMGLLPSDAIVLRNGTKVTIKASDLVVGDLVVLSQGARIPADMRLVSASKDLAFNRAVLTGESEEVPAELDSDEDNFLETKSIAFLGSYVTSGSGIGMVVLTGSETVMGRINRLTNTGKEKKTTLQREINRFISIIVTLTVSLILVMLIFWLAYLRKYHKGFLSTSGIVTNLMSIVVAFIPEGVPMGVTLTLSLVARRMRDADVLPKSLATVETLGMVNVLLSDKTGTLTANKMTVTTVYCDGEEQASDRALLKAPVAGSYETFERALILCNDAFFESSKPEPITSSESSIDSSKADDTIDSHDHKGIEPGQGVAKGNATDVAVLNYVASSDKYDSIMDEYERVFVLPFNSTNKFMMTANQQRGGARARTVLFKGAPDILLSKCAMSDASRQAIMTAQEHMSAKGQRVILVASRLPIASRSDPNQWWPTEEETRTLTDLEFLGLVGIVDPPKPEIPQTVTDCRRSGCRFFMVTGDFITTASAIAEMCGIFTSRDHVSRVADVPDNDSDAEPPARLAIEGKGIPLITQEQWDVICRCDEVVFARTTPEQKLSILTEFQQRQYVCAMTGDGTNDSPALRAADVGIAMVSGSDVALAAADLVLLGDFSSIIQGIRLGRLVFQNLQKVICYLLPAGSFSEDVPLVLNVFFGVPLPLSSFQMIIICLLTDLACSLCMIFEKEEFDLLSLPPRKQTEHLVGLKFYGHAYGFIGISEMLCAMSMYFLYLKQDAQFNIGDLFFAYEKWGTDGWHGYTSDQMSLFLNKAQSVYFITLVVMQIGNLVSVRSKRMSLLQSDPFFNKKRRNLTVLIGPFVSIAIAILVTEVGWFNRLFGTARVPIRFWLIPIPLALGLVCADECRKVLVRCFPRSIFAKLAW